MAYFDFSDTFKNSPLDRTGIKDLTNADSKHPDQANSEMEFENMFIFDSILEPAKEVTFDSIFSVGVNPNSIIKAPETEIKDIVANMNMNFGYERKALGSFPFPNNSALTTFTFAGPLFNSSSNTS